MKKGTKKSKVAKVTSKSKKIVREVKPKKAAGKSPLQARPVVIKEHAKPDIFSGKDADDEVSPERDEFLDPEEHPWTHEEQELRMQTGLANVDVYSREGRDAEEESDEIAPWEEGFMEGAEGRGQLGECDRCGKVLRQDKDQVIEREIRGEIVWFCSVRCAKAGPKRK